jgi:hypothetical protein
MAAFLGVKNFENTSSLPPLPPGLTPPYKHLEYTPRALPYSLPHAPIIPQTLHSASDIMYPPPFIIYLI